MKQRRIISIIAAFALACTVIFSSISREAVAASGPELNRTNVTMAAGTRYTLKVKNLPENARVT